MPRPRQQRPRQIEGKLSNSLVLNRFILDLFGTNRLEAMSEHLKGSDGLVDAGNRPIFTRSFKYLRGQHGLTAQEVYQDMLSLIFNSSISGAQLHLDNLKGKDGEIGLRIGSADYFGIINVGDSSTLAKRCEVEGISTKTKDYTERSLFATINKQESSLNVLIGSKKFTEGWSSWRVSTMGLLNVGRSEGSQIIQLFGRGVRLKGYRHSLKRTTKLDSSLTPPSMPKHIQSLETLHIFGIKADYMDEFKKYLEEEGLPTNDSDFKEFDIPIMPIVNLSAKKLKYLRVKEGKDFKREEVVKIVPDMLPYTPVTLDYYPKIQAMRSQKSVLDDIEGVRNEGKLSAQHLAFVDWNQVFFALIDFKNEHSWYNLNLSVNIVKEIAYKTDWYKLFIPQPDLEFTDFKRCVTLWQEVLTALLKGYIEKAYNDADISLSSFIISNTSFAAIKHWLDFEPNIMKTVEQMKEFNKHNILFQNDQKDMYVKMMIETMLS